MPELARRDLDEILARTESLWTEVRDSRIFLTGGTGFLGSWLLDSFAYANSRLNLNAQMVALTRQSRSSTDPAVHFHRGDIRTFEFPDGNFSHVIHGANPAARSESAELTETIVAGTQRLLDFCAAKKPGKLLYLSSGAVYGPQPRDLAAVPEDFEGATEDPYGRGKQMAESLCFKAAGLAATVARGFAFLGPRLPLDGSFAAGNFIRNLLRAEPIVVAGTGESVRSFLYSSDLTVWLWTILFRGSPGRAYNVGSDEAITVKELAEKIANRARPALPVRILGDRGAGESRYVPSIERAQRELGLAVTVGLDDAIGRTVDWSHAG